MPTAAAKKKAELAKKAAAKTNNLKHKIINKI